MISFFRRLLRVGVPAEAIGQENEANLRLMMDNSVDVILRVGPDLLRYVSPSSLQLFGWTPQYCNALMPIFTCARADLSRLCMTSRSSAETSGRMPMTVRLRTSRRVSASSLNRSASSSRGSFGLTTRGGVSE